MRKKKEKELKDKLKKEILMELLKEEEKKEKEIAKPVKPPVLHHSKEEIQSIRESFLKVFLFSATVLFIIIVILILDPFSNKKTKEESNNNGQEEVIEKVPTLVDREDGIIENSNKEILKMFFLLEPNNYEYYMYDSTYLYSKDELLMKDVPSSYLLYMTSKSDEFNEYIQSQELLTKLEICSKDGNIRIPKEDIDNIFENIYGFSIKEYDDFIYTYYVNGLFSTYIRFIYSDGYYVSRCDVNNEPTMKYNSVAMPVISQATKENEIVKIKSKVSFITKNKVYADYELKNVISDNPNSDMLTYISNASDYEYIYKLNNNKYYLEKIVKVTK